jgi:hypothetical protein
MAANALTFNDIAIVLNQVVTQATGQAQIVPTNTSDFVTVAQTGLLAGYDNLMSAISQVLSRTIISQRAYDRKFRGLEADSIRWGNHVRKINYADRAWQSPGRLPITNGVAVDDQKPVLDNVLQTNFYGQNDYEIQWTLFSNQLDVSFESPEALGAFVSGKMQTISDQVEQKHESMARMIIANMIAGILSINNAPQIVHLLTEYNAQTGLSLTATTVYDPANYPAFIKWVYGRIAQVSSMLTERSIVYHQNVTGKEIARHTPYERQLVYLYAGERYGIESRVIADVFHDNYLKLADTESVNFWQSIGTPDSINIVPTYMKTDGTLDTPQSAVSQSKIFGIIADDEAMGYTICNQRTTQAAYNGEGEYQNFWIKFTDRYWNDFTENAVIFLLD